MLPTWLVRIWTSCEYGELLLLLVHDVYFKAKLAVAPIGFDRKNTLVFTRILLKENYESMAMLGV